MTAFTSMAVNFSPSWTSAGFSSVYDATPGLTIDTDGRSPLAQSAKKAGMSYDDLLHRIMLLGAHYPADSPTILAAEGRRAAPIDHAAIAAVRITRPEGGARRFPSDKLQLFTLEHFLSAGECDAIVAIIGDNLRPSTVTIAGPDRHYRTSRTCDLSLLRLAAITRLDEKIARTLGERVGRSEGIQAQRYAVGQEFKRHTDYFEPGSDEYRQHARQRGNRTWTFMVYLNAVARGGATRFFAIEHDFLPVKGMAVIWNNLHADGTVNADTLHAGLPVEEGEKLIITKWFRERG